MVPKIIHYCWFGPSPLPPIIKKCLASWKEVMPDYEIKKWDENNIPIDKHRFMKEAYDAKKYAFVSDYARYWILNQYGGIFLDCDVEILRPLDELMETPVTFGINKHIKRNVVFVNPGLFIGVEPRHPLMTEILNFYDSISFLDKEGKANLRNSSPRILTKILAENYGFLIIDKTQILRACLNFI